MIDNGINQKADVLGRLGLSNGASNRSERRRKATSGGEGVAQTMTLS
jgi:hypothetical protein